MPTNVLRRGQQTPPSRSQDPPQPGTAETVVLSIAGNPLRMNFHQTPSARRIRAALPLFSVAETWGECIHFEIPIAGGRDRTARINAQIGGLYYWAEERRLLLIFGPTPISGNGLVRLPRPCNLVGDTRDKLSSIRQVPPGQKVMLKLP
jgi:hypothetical protein